MRSPTGRCSRTQLQVVARTAAVRSDRTMRMGKSLPRQPRLAVIVVLLAAAGGCRIIDYSGADGRRLKIVSVGNDTAVGKLDVATPEGGTLGLENLDSNARLAD